MTNHPPKTIVNLPLVCPARTINLYIVLKLHPKCTPKSRNKYFIVKLIKPYLVNFSAKITLSNLCMKSSNLVSSMMSLVYLM